MAMNITKIEFQADSALVTMRDPNGISGETRKRVAIEALISGLGKISTCTSMLIPPNCRGIWETKGCKYFLFVVPAHMGKTAVRWGSEDSRRFGTPNVSSKLLEQPDYIQDMYMGAYEDAEDIIRVFDTPFPDACVLIKMSKLGGSDKLVFNSIRAWALKSTMLPLAKTPLYRWPFFNMYHDARVCIGDIPCEYPTVEAVSSILNYLFIGVGNHDLDSTPYIKGDNTMLNTDSPFELVRVLHEKQMTTFPKELLVNFSSSVIETVENIIANQDHN